MERDFTTACYQEFCTLIDRINDENWNGITDWFGDRFRDLKHLLADWGILGEAARIEAHYTTLLERENASKDAIRQVFENISALDKSSANDNLFIHCKHAVKYYRQCLSLLMTLTADGSSGNFSSVFSASRIRTILQSQTYPFKGLETLNASSFMATFYMISQEYKESFISTYERLHSDQLNQIDEALSNFNLTDLEKLDIKYLICAGPEPYRSALKDLFLLSSDAPFTASTFSELSQHYKTVYISGYEFLYPHHREKLNNIFSDPDWTEQEMLDIKFITYCAPEPYRSIYLEHLDLYKIAVFQENSADKSEDGISCYSAGQIYLEDSDKPFLYDALGPYNTFFHESGHAIDDYERPEGSLSRNFEYNGKSLFHYIVEDARNYLIPLVKKEFSDLTDEEMEQAIIGFNLSDDSTFGKEDSLEELPSSVFLSRAYFCSTLNLDGRIHAATSDIYSGVTNRMIAYGYGHTNKEYYWYNEDGSPTKAQCSELWAEFFAAQMTHDEEALASIREHFPTAYPALEEMAREMAAK